jgi:hypothetical protein
VRRPGGTDRRGFGVPLRRDGRRDRLFALKEDREKALTAGCDDYHVKPVHFSELLDQMEAPLGEAEEA